MARLLLARTPEQSPFLRNVSLEKRHLQDHSPLEKVLAQEALRKGGQPTDVPLPYESAKRAPALASVRRTVPSNAASFPLSPMYLCVYLYLSRVSLLFSPFLSIAFRRYLLPVSQWLSRSFLLHALLPAISQSPSCLIFSPSLTSFCYSKAPVVAFTDDLERFMKVQGKPIRTQPVVDGHPVDLYALFCECMARGGVEQVRESEG